ncbi:hypothetical protein KC19_2G087200 [Ceratodon purpureus]|uniref:Uncharacterized protein n=1 Tax=Ceratodon purpureus TaxID=3225 RepID=A0A8T0ITA5_CERPU|nr:hypothetical protein KC19_2G087200 [Ceratodon purpureus]
MDNFLKRLASPCIRPRVRSSSPRATGAKLSCRTPSPTKRKLLIISKSFSDCNRIPPGVTSSRHLVLILEIVLVLVRWRLGRSLLRVGRRSSSMPRLFGGSEV